MTNIGNIKDPLPTGHESDFEHTLREGPWVITKLLMGAFNKKFTSWSVVTFLCGFTSKYPPLLKGGSNSGSLSLDHFPLGLQTEREKQQATMQDLPQEKP